MISRVKTEEWWKYTSLLRAYADLDVLIDNRDAAHSRLGHRSTLTQDLFAFLFGVRDTFIFNDNRHHSENYPSSKTKTKKKNEIRAIEDEKKLLKIRNCFDCVKLFVEIMSGAANLFLPVEIDTGENCEYVRFTSMASRKCVSQFVFAIAISIASRHIYQSEENGTCKQVSQPRRVCRALSLPPAK